MQDSSSTAIEISIRELEPDNAMEGPQSTSAPNESSWDTSILEKSTATLEQSAQYLQDLIQTLNAQKNMNVDGDSVASSYKLQNTLSKATDLQKQIAKVLPSSIDNHHNTDKDSVCGGSCNSASVPSQADTSIDDDEFSLETEVTFSESIVSFETCSDGSIEVTETDLCLSDSDLDLPKLKQCPPSPPRPENTKMGSFVQNAYFVVCDACSTCTDSSSIREMAGDESSSDADQVILDGSQLLDSDVSSPVSGEKEVMEIEEVEVVESEDKDIRKESASCDGKKENETSTKIEVRKRSVTFRPKIVSQEITYDCPSKEEKTYLFYTGRELHQFRMDYMMELQGYNNNIGTNSGRGVKRTPTPMDDFTDISGSMRMFWSLYAAILRLLHCGTAPSFCCGQPQTKMATI